MVSTTKKIIVVLVVCVLAFSSYWYLLRPQTMTSIQQPMYSLEEESSNSFVNVTQGSTWQKNETWYVSLNEEVSIPFENLMLLRYNKTSDILYNQKNILNYTFSPNPIIILPHGYNTTVLTVTMAEDAPIGRYDLIWTLGNSNVTNISAYGLIVRVNPK